MSIKDPTSSPIIPRTQTPLPGVAPQQVDTRPTGQPSTDRFDARPLDHRPATDVVAPGTSTGVVITAALRQKLAPFLKERPKKGFGYIVAQGDVLDQLLEEAYQDSEQQNGSDEDRLDKWIEAFLMYNRHLGLDTAAALQTAIGQLLFFPELNEMLDLRQKLEGTINPLNFPGIEAFMKLASLPPEASAYFHFISGKGPNPAPSLGLRADNNEARRGLGKRTKRWKTENVPNSMSRMARTAGSTVLTLVEEARNHRTAKPSKNGALNTEES